MTELNLRLYDTLGAQLTTLVPRRAGEVRVYCCGPTTYDVAHVGHARAALAPDILVRHLKSLGLQTRYVRNITDVDDKILKRASETGEPPLELSNRMAQRYQDDMRKLGCLDPDVEPKVSEHIAEIIQLVERLIERGAAYAVDMKAGGRDVYYAVREFAEYGKLSKRKVEDLRVGARIEASRDKRDPLDFALWKGNATDDAWGWDSPWGKGRPGWHIECSAMSATYLGYGFDVHCGGMDLIFPHHENEIAQSEAAGLGEGPFAGTWIHNGFVNVDKEKMAKSLGNFVTIADVYERNDPDALRYFLLTVHYRGPIAFDTDKLDNGRVVFPGVDEAERRVDYLYQTYERLAALTDVYTEDTLVQLPKELAPFEKCCAAQDERIGKALDDDLNTPVVLSVIAEVAKQGNEFCDLVQKRRKDKVFAQAAPVVAMRLARTLRSGTERLGLLHADAKDYEARTRAQRLAIRNLTAETVQGKITERSEARASKDFARGDALRAELDAEGIEIFDSPEGTTWRIRV